MKRPANAMPGFVAKALSDRDLKEHYDARPWYQRNDYLGWINAAKREETKAKRLRQMLDELEAGDVYMKMAWRPRK
ncbi:MAG: YdeI/OmpD-associated family protein [Paracoccaceae bacterium]|nr:YdeI/OmpD-associated family protein [Paracoccaceae bacterium]